MYEAKIKGKKVRLTKEQYRTMRRRWNPRNFKEGKVGGTTTLGCVLCELYEADDCVGCTFAQFDKDKTTYGCLWVLHNFLKPTGGVLSFSLGLTWISYFDKKGKEDIKKVYDLIGTKFKKV